MSLNDFILRNSKIKNDPKLMGTLIALCEHIGYANISPSSQCKIVAEINKLGPIVFCAPELGRWSTVGGLGVMVDELSLGLVALGQ